jgi:hypothetical protein
MRGAQTGLNVDTTAVSLATAMPVPASAWVPLSYVPPYLQEKILVSRAALEGERQQVTGLCRGRAGRSDRVRSSLTPNYCAI